MNKEQLKRIFEFLEDKEQQNPPFRWKHINNIPLTEEDLNVKGDLDLSQTQITSLPEGLKVGGDLDLSYTAIKILPKGLVVYGNLNVSGTPLEDVYDEIQMYDELIKPGFIRGGVIFSWPNDDDDEEDEHDHY